QNRPVPAWLAAVAARGRRDERDERFGSMQALLEALAREPASRRRRFAVRLGLAAAALFPAGAVAVAVNSQSHGAGGPCGGARAQLAGIWDGARREQVRGALVATAEPDAANVATLVARSLDGYASAWIDRHTEACAATAIRHEQSPAMLDRRMACLAA